VAISAGGTREPIDPVRFLGNRSSGRQGVALALEAADRGAKVLLVSAHIGADVLGEASTHPRVRVEPVSTAIELGAAMTDASRTADIVVMAAAVADYRPATASPTKLTKEGGPLRQIALVENDDVVAGLAAARANGAAPDGQVIVAFAAETSTSPQERRERARRKRASKGVDLLAVNLADAEHGFEVADNAVEIIGEGGEVVGEAAGPKRVVAAAIVDAIAALRG
jgi:phosphopantothenoylcysteine decarboxylase/phosphopantothenate--cysteine ligase